MNFKVVSSVETLIAKSDPKKERVPWIGCDLDGTLAKYEGWKGWEHIGEPVPKMLEDIKELIKKGYIVKILTARASKVSLARNNLKFEQMEKVIQDWTQKHLGAKLDVVTEKDCDMICFFDDSAVQIEKNTGKVLGKLLPFVKEEPNQELKDYDSADVNNQAEWNDVKIDPSCINDLTTGLCKNGFATATPLDMMVTTGGKRIGIEAKSDQVIARYILDTCSGNLTNEPKCWWLAVEAHVANGSNKMFYKLDGLSFSKLGGFLARSSRMLH